MSVDEVHRELELQRACREVRERLRARHHGVPVDPLLAWHALREAIRARYADSAGEGARR